MTWKTAVVDVPFGGANAGGVVSYFEWTQNIQQFRWEHQRINDELGKVMRKAYRSLLEIAQKKNIDMRTAAFVLAIRRVGQATLTRVHINTRIPLWVSVCACCVMAMRRKCTHEW